MNQINDYSRALMFLIGMNGSGKTHALNEALKEERHQAFMITEDGMPFIPKHMNRVSINFEKKIYNYTNEALRGQSIRNTEQEEISSNSLNVILFCNKIIRKLSHFQKKSKGQNKLFSIMTVFTSYNLNNIRIIYFDEPENFMDEEFLKVIAEFFRLLINNNFIVRVATHNSRLLNILKTSLEDVILFNSHSQFIVLDDEIKKIYHSASSNVEKIRNSHKIEIDASIKYKLDLPDVPRAFDNFVEQTLKSEEFYRCLFYKKIVIVEGISDIVTLSSIKNDFENSIEIFNANGKAFIPFFVDLFNRLNKEVIVIIDDDIRERNGVIHLKHPIAITKHLEEKNCANEIKLVVHSPDLEGFYGIELEKIGKELGMSSSVRDKKGWTKLIAAFIFFSDERNKQRLKSHIFGFDRDSTFEFQ